MGTSLRFGYSLTGRSRARLWVGVLITFSRSSHVARSCIGPLMFTPEAITPVRNAGYATLT